MQRAGGCWRCGIFGGVRELGHGGCPGCRQRWNSGGRGVLPVDLCEPSPRTGGMRCQQTCTRPLENEALDRVPADVSLRAGSSCRQLSGAAPPTPTVSPPLTDAAAACCGTGPLSARRSARRSWSATMECPLASTRSAWASRGCRLLVSPYGGWRRGGGGSCGTGVAGQQERHGDREGGGAGGDLHANPRPPQQLSHPPAPPCAPLPPPGDREDPVSMALTVTQQLLDRHGISPLEVRCGALLWAAICSCRRISDGQQHLQQ